MHFPFFLSLSDHFHRQIVRQFGENQSLVFHIKRRNSELVLLFIVIRAFLHNLQLAWQEHYVYNSFEKLVFFCYLANIVKQNLFIHVVLFIDILEFHF